jgi:flagellin
MSIGISTGTALNSLSAYQQQLTKASNQASSGSSLGADSASAVAIYNVLTSQAQGADQANANISDAGNAINVAQGAASGIGDALGQLQNLVIEAGNGFNSSSDNAALQAQANQLVQQINTDAASANFNGTPLLDGTNSGSTPATAAAAEVTNNDLSATGGNVLQGVTATGATQSGTIAVQIANTGAGAVANVTFTDSTTQQTTNVGQFAANSTTTVNGTQITFGNFTTNDTNSTATVQTTAAAAATTSGSTTVQSGANAGQTTTVTTPNATTTGLGIANIDFSTPANATNSLGQISNAISKLNAGQAALGAQSAALTNAFNNNNTSSVNLTASASQIGDAKESSLAVELSSLRTQQQISIATINNANVTQGYLNRFFSVSA